MDISDLNENSVLTFKADKTRERKEGREEELETEMLKMLWYFTENRILTSPLCCSYPVDT